MESRCNILAFRGKAAEKIQSFTVCSNSGRIILFPVMTLTHEPSP